MTGLQLSHMILLALAGVGLGIAMVGVWGVIKHKRETAWAADFIENAHDEVFNDDGIVAIRRRPNPEQQQTYDNQLAEVAYDNTNRHYQQAETNGYADDLIIFNILAKTGQSFVGYDLLQAILAAGLRYGDMAIFHRYQDPQGKGPILFSLANINDPGTFDLPDMSNTETQGLTLFMRRAYQPTIDCERFDLMLTAAHQITEALPANLYTATNQPLTNQHIDSLRTELTTA